MFEAILEELKEFGNVVVSNLGVAMTLKDMNCHVYNLGYGDYFVTVNRNDLVGGIEL